MQVENSATARIAQLVERDVANVEVVGSSPISRSISGCSAVW